METESSYGRFAQVRILSEYIFTNDVAQNIEQKQNRSAVQVKSIPPL